MRQKIFDTPGRICVVSMASGVPHEIPVHCSFDELLELYQIKPNPRNPNTHPDAQVEKLSNLMLSLGVRAAIVVSKRTGLVTKGHGRLMAAKKAGFDKFPVEYQDYSDDSEEWADIMADNAIAEMAVFSVDLASEQFKALYEQDADLALNLGFNEDDITSMLAGMEQQELNVSDSFEADADLGEGELNSKWGVERGHVYSIGPHRLMCGDCTNPEDVSRLLDGRSPGIMVTDPPYGVNYDANWRNEAIRADGTPYGGRAVGKVSNDDRADWRQAWELFKGAVAYVWHDGTSFGLVAESLEVSGFDIRSQIVWAKNMFVISRGHYHWQHELCAYAVRDGVSAEWSGKRDQSTLWMIDKPNRSETGHSTQKPLECMARPIENHSFAEVYDPFCGSGTTIVACENYKRNCLAMEIDPEHCARTLERMSLAFPKLTIEKV